ncbi:ATP-binding protein [Inquilinus limosus]|uniref:AAA family ATPase n=1 Tax=Inquilinus limosus TaxID=171674 RepID=UPI003F16DF5E
MITLRIEKFAGIWEAKIQIAPMTVIIGPQGSGKSLAAKLLYFFCDIMNRQYRFAEEGVKYEEMSGELVSQFKTWFPASAWGQERFTIDLVAGNFEARIKRRTRKNEVTDDISISFSAFYKKYYNILLNEYSNLSPSDDDEFESGLSKRFERAWSLRNRMEDIFLNFLGSDYIGFQTFVPASRSFFTSAGKFLAAIDDTPTFDPLTTRFAKLFGALREQALELDVYRGRRTSNMDAEQREVMRRILGGEVIFQRSGIFLQTEDGRKVPFNTLSSGQQEVFPIWLLIKYFSEDGRSSRKYRSMFYIEEPEAHLFPTAQSELLDYLMINLVSVKERNLLLTTHSPYVLSKINTYLKAGILARRKNIRQDIENIIPRKCWLTPMNVRAYAIEHGHFLDLIDEGGLIDSSYIDGASDRVARIFDRLLDVEYGDSK